MVFSVVSRKPALIVFDLGVQLFLLYCFIFLNNMVLPILDYTLWPFDCDDYYGAGLYKKCGRFLSR